MTKLVLSIVLILCFWTGVGYAQDTSYFETTTSTQMMDQSPSRHRFAWGSSILGLDATNASEQEKLVDFRLKLKGSTELTQSLKLNFEAAVRMQNGSNQSLNASDNNENRILLKHAVLQFKPTPAFVASAGAIDMEATHSQLTIDSMPFPGARVATNYYFSEQSYIGLFAETAIPTSASLATNTQEFEKTPSINTLGFTHKTLWSEHGEFNLRLNYSQWDQLPSSVAAKSYLLGNSVNIISEELGSYIYKYSVIELSGMLKFSVASNMALSAFVDGLYNTEAPEQLNKAYLVGAAGHFYSGENQYTLKGYSFYIERDATVAYYGPTLFFNTNRNGYAAELSVDFKNFKITTRFADAELIFEDENQSREKSLLVKLETSYVAF